MQTPKSATMRLIELAERLTPSGEIGDGMVAQFHELATLARLEQAQAFCDETVRGVARSVGAFRPAPTPAPPSGQGRCSRCKKDAPAGCFYARCPNR